MFSHFLLCSLTWKLTQFSKITYLCTRLAIMLNFNRSKVPYFHEPLIIQTTETIPSSSSSKCHSAINGLTLPYPTSAGVWTSQQNFPFNISFFYQYWYKRSVLRLFKTDYGDSLSAERISPQQTWCSGKLSACLPWYTYCQVSTIFASEFRRKKSRC